MNEQKHLIALLGNELIIREDIQIDKLRELYPEIIRKVTPHIFKVDREYKIDGHKHIILQADFKDVLGGPPKKRFVTLQDYFCPIFISSCESPEEISDHVWMKISTKEGQSWINQIFKFNDVYQYLRPNIWDIPEEYDQLDFYTYKNVPIRTLSRPYRIKLDLKLSTTIPIQF